MAKPSDFFVGITDLFSILLPGAAVAYVCLKVEENLVPSMDVLGLRGLDEKEGYIAFLAVAYLLGHVLDMAGAMVLDPLYDATYANWKRSSSMHFKEWVGRRLRWAGQDERDRSAALDDLLYREARRMATPAMPPRDRVYQWSRSCVGLKSPLAFTEIERLQGNSKFFRGMVSVSIVTLLLLLLPGLCVPHKALAGLICLILALTSFVRFCDLRWKAVQQTYRFFIALRSEPAVASALESSDRETEGD